MRGFAIVHFTVEDDPRLSDIYPDDALFGLWTRLLVQAEKSWPAPAYIPYGTNRGRLSRLVAAGVLELVGKDRFRFHGLDAERQRRVDQGKAAAKARWSAPRNAPSIASSNADAMHARAGTSPSTSTSSSPVLPQQDGAPSRARDPEELAFDWLAVHGAGFSEGNGLYRRLVELSRRHGAERVIATFESFDAGMTGRQYVLGAENVLDKIPKPDGKAEREAELELTAKRRRERTAQYLAELRGAS